jgi:hypothetical protein
VRILPGLILSLLLLMALSGCFIPPAVTLASLAADGVSLAASGKSLKDHALSEVTGEDCAMWRVVKNDDICLVEVGASETVLVAYKGPETVYDGPWTEPPLSTADIDVMRRGFLHLGEHQVFEQITSMREPSGLTTYAPSSSERDDTVVAAQDIADSAPGFSANSPKTLSPEAALAPAQTPASTVIRPVAPGAGGSDVTGGRALRQSDYTLASIQVASAAVPGRSVSDLPFDMGTMMPVIPGDDGPAVGPSAGLQFFAPSTAASMGQVASLASVEMSAVAHAVGVPPPVRESWSDETVAAVVVDAAALEKDVYLVLGSYTEQNQAQRVAGRFGDLAAQVRAAIVRGEARYRVIAGPYVLPEAQARRDSIAGTGVEAAWITRL